VEIAVEDAAWQLHLQTADRQIPHFQVQLLHFGPGEAPLADTASGSFGV
jgi:hypothetical protein